MKPLEDRFPLGTKFFTAPENPSNPNKRQKLSAPAVIRPINTGPVERKREDIWAQTRKFSQNTLEQLADFLSKPVHRWHMIQANISGLPAEAVLRKSVRNSVGQGCNFLVMITGRSGSGKTTILKYIKNILGTNLTQEGAKITWNSEKAIISHFYDEERRLNNRVRPDQNDQKFLNAKSGHEVSKDRKAYEDAAIRFRYKETQIIKT